MTEPRKDLILLVDDCADTREMYKEFFLPVFEVAEAATGEEALRKAAELQPRAIVMDLALPDMGGKEAILRLKGNKRTLEIPVVVVSGFQEQKDASSAWDAYLVKPCHPDALLTCIARLIERTRR